MGMVENLTILHRLMPMVENDVLGLTESEQIRF